MPEEVEEQTVTVGMQKGGKTFRAPPRWNIALRRLTGFVPLHLEKCEACTAAEGEDSYHLYVMNPGQKPPVCTETLMICPCGCNKSFRYDRREQRRLMEKVR